MKRREGIPKIGGLSTTVYVAFWALSCRFMEDGKSTYVILRMSSLVLFNLDGER